MVKKSKAGVTRQAIELKAQARSHTRHSAVEWAKLLREQRRSGFTVDVFCTERRLAKSTFWYWRRRVAVSVTQGEVAEVGTAANFLAVPVSAPNESFEILAGDLRVRLEGVAAQRVLDAIVARIAGAT